MGPTIKKKEKTMTVKPIPDGYHTLTPYLFVEDVAGFLDFLGRAFGAEVTECLKTEEGAITHAEARIGDSMIMMSPGKGDFQPMPASFYLYVEDTDATYHSALEAGSVSVMEPADQFYGDRNAGVKDPAGNDWWIATHQEDLTSEELARSSRAPGKG